MTSARPDPTRPVRLPARGASLIELMVGLVVCLLISLAAAKSAELFGAIQRQGVATGGGTTNAISALAAIKEDVAAGGVGFFADGAYRCTNLNLSVGNNVVANNTGFFPVQARRVGANDQLDVVYAQEVAGGAWTELKETSNGSTAVLDSRLPVFAGQQPAVLLARSTTNLASPCLVRSVTNSANPAAGTRQTLTFGIAGNHNQGVFAVTPDFQRYEPVILLGNLNWNRYELQGTNLVIRRLMNNTTATVLPNVVAFRVQYGVSAGATNTEIANWVNSDNGAWTTINELNAMRVRAVRIGVVFRSAQREKGDAQDGDQCKAVPPDQNSITLFAGTPTPVAITPPGADWRCFRYRTSEVVAPLRNLTSGTRSINWPSTPP